MDDIDNAPFPEHRDLIPDVERDFSYPILSGLEKSHDTFENSPEYLVDQALSMLHEDFIKPVEWRTLLYRRMGVPAVIINQHFLVSDGQLDLASSLLSALLPQSPPPSHLNTDGDFYAKGRFFRITRSTDVESSQYIVLYPASFAAFDSDDLSPLVRHTELEFSIMYKILVPAPHAVFASMVRMMRAYPRLSPTRKALQSELAALIGHHLYGLPRGYVDPNDEQLRAVPEVGQGIERGVNTVEEWRKSGLLGGADESWIGDVLADVVAGRLGIDEIPWAPA